VGEVTLFLLSSLSWMQDISALEAVKVDALDAKLVQESYGKAKSAFDSAEAGSVGKAEAQIRMETSKAMAAAIGVSL
jgi:enhancing lycopene biosynthesis protein 2